MIKYLPRLLYRRVILIVWRKQNSLRCDNHGWVNDMRHRYTTATIFKWPPRATVSFAVWSSSRVLTVIQSVLCDVYVMFIAFKWQLYHLDKCKQIVGGENKWCYTRMRRCYFQLWTIIARVPVSWWWHCKTASLFWIMWSVHKRGFTA